MDKKYFFSFIDDVIWAFRDVTRQKPASLFDNPFFKILKNAHENYGLKVQLNLFYRTDYSYGVDEFTLAEMTDAYKAEFTAASDWLKLGVHALQEFPDYPFVNATYNDVYEVYSKIKNEILRFAGEKSFGYGMIPHWLPVSFEGCRALYDLGVPILGVTVGKREEYNGDPDSLPYGHSFRLRQGKTPETMTFTRLGKNVAISRSVCSYNHVEDPEFDQNDKVLGHIIDEATGLKFKKLDDEFDLNQYTLAELKEELARRAEHTLMCIGNHEQYFYSDYADYQPEYEEKIYEMARTLKNAGRECIFIEELANMG